MKVIEFKRENTLSFGFRGEWLEIEGSTQVCIEKNNVIEYAARFLDGKKITAGPGGFVDHGSCLYTFEHQCCDEMKLVIRLDYSEARDLATFIVEHGND